MFKIAPSRGSEVLIEVLGREFDGVLGCDYFSAYRKYMRDCGVLVQFCLAHLIRDLKFLAEHPNLENQSYGRRVLEACVRVRCDPSTRPHEARDVHSHAGNCWQCVVSKSRQGCPSHIGGGESCSSLQETRRELHQVHNNTRDRADQQLGGASDSLRGHRPTHNPRLAERNWTALARADLDDIATCTQQGRSVFEFILEAVRANFHGEPAPTLVPNTS